MNTVTSSTTKPPTITPIAMQAGGLSSIMNFALIFFHSQDCRLRFERDYQLTTVQTADKEWIAPYDFTGGVISSWFMAASRSRNQDSHEQLSCLGDLTFRSILLHPPSAPIPDKLRQLNKTNDNEELTTLNEISSYSDIIFDPDHNSFLTESNLKKIVEFDAPPNNESIPEVTIRIKIYIVALLGLKTLREAYGNSPHTTTVKQSIYENIDKALNYILTALKLKISQPKLPPYEKELTTCVDSSDEKELTTCVDSSYEKELTTCVNSSDEKRFYEICRGFIETNDTNIYRPQAEKKVIELVNKTNIVRNKYLTPFRNAKDLPTSEQN